MKTSIRRSKSARKARSASKAALGRYLAAGLGATGLASVDSEAAIVSIDVTTLGLTTGANAGVASGSVTTVDDFIVDGRSFAVANNTGVYGYFGFTFPNNTSNANGVVFANGGGSYSPINFAVDSIIGSGILAPNNQSAWNGVGAFSPLFAIIGYGSTPAFPPSPSSHIAFRVAANGTGPFFTDATDWNYGYFRVTWNTTNEFRILDGAYESTVNTPITVVPEPTGLALAGIGALALGAGAIRRSRKARRAAAEGTLAEAV